MKFPMPRFLLVAGLVASSVSASQARKGQPLSAYGVVPEAIERIEILYVPERILTRTALTPDMLERQYHYKIEIRNFSQSLQRPKFLSAFRETSVSPGSAHDLRTAVLLYGQGDKRLLSLYFDRSGENGAVNRDFVSTTDSIFHWAKSMMRGFAE
jgi:hypothetical protein